MTTKASCLRNCWWEGGWKVTCLPLLLAILSPPRTWALIIEDIFQKQRFSVMFPSSSKAAHFLPQWLLKYATFLRSAAEALLSLNVTANSTAKCMQLIHELIPLPSFLRKKASLGEGWGGTALEGKGQGLGVLSANGQQSFHLHSVYRRKYSHQRNPEFPCWG